MCFSQARGWALGSEQLDCVSSGIPAAWLVLGAMPLLCHLGQTEHLLTIQQRDSLCDNLCEVSAMCDSHV